MAVNNKMANNPSESKVSQTYFIDRNIIYKLIAFGALYFPEPAANGIGKAIAFTLCFFIKRMREEQYKNIRIILGKDANEKEVRRIVKRIWQNWGRYLLDFFRLSRLDKNNLNTFVSEIKGREIIERALKKGRGAIIITAHLGNWELGALCLQLTGFKTNVIKSPYESDNINITLGKVREKNNINTIHIRKNDPTFILRIHEALKKNELVTIQGDRDIERKGVLIDFFGKPAYFPRGPMLIAMKTKSPVIPAFTYIDSNGLYHSVAEEEIEIEDTGNEEMDLKINMERTVRVIERYVRKYPEQWYNFYYFWEK